ncbi:bile acid:sodium symporter family protein [Halobellus inordinatus]|uniref:bile acid:sodium symporter family protein n=1 Tax=Halobellus inordinatus TaxID=1126236 RepID=UPI0021096B09|nr:bile acid:sodium symporter [Halobellus inordinatus]
MAGISTDVIVAYATTIFVLSTMFVMGLELSISQLSSALRRRRLMGKSLLVNLVVAPLVAYVLVQFASVESGYAAGIILLAVSPGAPFGPKLAEISDSDIAFASGLMAVLGIVSVLTIPASLALLVSGDVAVNPIAIGSIVFRMQLVPLIAGLGVAFYLPGLADRLHPPVQQVSDYSFVGLLALLAVVYSGEMVSLVGTGILGISAVAVGIWLLLGYVLGGPARSAREVLATTSAARNAAIALFIATAAFSDPNVLTTVLAFSFVGVIGSALVARVWR